MSITSTAQIENYYTFSESSETYAPLMGADETILEPFTRYTINLPFEFEFSGKKIPYLFLTDSGILFFGGVVTPQPNDLSDIGQQNFGASSIIAPLWDNNLGLSSPSTTAKSKTLLEGTAPNRTYTIEWENIPWSTIGSQVSFRVILEETTNNIKFLYGPNLSTETQTASIGINTEFSSDISFLSITPGTTTTVSNTTANNSISTSDYPGEGKSYLFTYTSPTCKIPSELRINFSSLTPFTAEANWQNAASETQWDILVIDQNDQTSTTVAANTNPFTLNNLDEDTNYSISIRANCQANGTSEYSSQFFFTTPAVCPKPQSLATNNVTLDSADITWVAGDQETSWEAYFWSYNQYNQF
ncbi:hypothetical protein AB832_01625 [Flavobacteriaceae bacterium (ex Bugula neritina AB1)]|nr:hypothetical protein AB832_01625 [Flavobacteriaceae bacterium (ex Bugula neritina AB1)]